MRGDRDNRRDRDSRVRLGRALVALVPDTDQIRAVCSTVAKWADAQIERLKTEALHREIAHVQRNHSRRGRPTRHGEALRAKIRGLVTAYRLQHPKRSTSRMVTDLLATWDAKTPPRKCPSRSTFYEHLKSLDL